MTDESGSEVVSQERRQRIAALKQELVGGDLLTAAEVAEVLDIHPRTVGEYIRDGKLRAFAFGGGWKVSENALRAFVREQTQGPPAPGGDASHPVLRAIGDALTKLAPGAPGDEGRTPGRSAPAGAYRCSFCGKDNSQVRRLIAGPRRVFICDECVRLCNTILAEQEGLPAPQPQEPAPAPSGAS